VYRHSDPGSWGTRHVQSRKIQAVVYYEYIDVICMLDVVRRHKLKQPAKVRRKQLFPSSGVMREGSRLGVHLERAVGVCMVPVNN
jgi:hypothetical protein